MDVQAHLRGAYERAAPTYDRAAFSHHAPFGERLAQMVLLGREGGTEHDLPIRVHGRDLPGPERHGCRVPAQQFDEAHMTRAELREDPLRGRPEPVRRDRLDPVHDVARPGSGAGVALPRQEQPRDDPRGVGLQLDPGVTDVDRHRRIPVACARDGSPIAAAC